MHIYAPEGPNLSLGFLELNTELLSQQSIFTYKLLETMVGLDDKYKDHPLTRLWAGHVSALANYGYVCDEVLSYLGVVAYFTEEFRIIRRGYYKIEGSFKPPAFLDELKEAHRAELVELDPKHYGHIWPERNT